MKRNITLLILFRCLFFFLLIYLLDLSIDFGTSVAFLSLGAVLGVIVSSRLAFTKLNSLGFFCICFAVYLFYRISIYLFSLINFSKNGYYFLSTVVDSHLSVFLLISAIAAVTTWLFWKISFTLTAEIITLIVMSVSLLSGHRNFHFENPKILNDLTWELGLQPLSVLLILGLFILLFITFYAYLASLTNKLHFAKNSAGSIFSRGRPRIIYNFLSLALLSLITFLITNGIFKYYDKEALSRTANGVGQEKESGVSPLDFHSALGSTNQPSAMVRLEGDYTENPFLPMIYMRESALSDFNGKEMVISSGYDQDVNSTSPDQVYKIEENQKLTGRVKLTQSVFLLSDHKLAFAIDYPIEIKQVKNPNPKRFKSSYRALSMVPTFKLDNIRNSELGDPEWSQEIWKHYLKTSPDQRYADLAMKITGSYANTAQVTTEKAFQVTSYLNKNAIYTLTPNHEVKTGEDPVVPFLFGDMRGYCVHFAHATVYMLRALGIPSRIATGYLTDFSQARDGHILLRMSDRHAWAEVYIRELGWVPFDTQPEKVESHAETQVDMKLLEELMGMLEPGDDILPDSTLDNEKNVFEESPRWIPQPQHVYILLFSLFLALIMIKLYLRYGWILKSNPASRLRSAYVSFASVLYDLGFRRLHGETRKEFKERIVTALSTDTFMLTDSLNNINYSESCIFNNQLTAQLRKQDLNALKKLPAGTKLIAALSPSSVIAYLRGHRW